MYGLGSISGIPILETQFSDVSSYISTNVISITDGQIFCCSKLFLDQMKPSIDLKLSVSRVGSNLKLKSIKKNLKI